MTYKQLVAGFLFALSYGYVDSQNLSSPGDITVVGMFEIFEPDGNTCSDEVSINSVMYAEAVRWYFKKLDVSGDLPISIGFEAYATCQVKSRAAEEATKLVNRVLESNYRPTAKLIAGVIGPEYSTEASVVSPILSAIDPEKHLVQVGFSVTAAILQDRAKHPNIFSVVQDDDIQIEAMIKSMIELGWNRIAIIYEDTLLGREASSSLTEQAKLASICIALTSSIDVTNGVSSSRITEIRDAIIHGTGERSSINGYVFFGSSRTASLLFTSIKTSGFKSAPIAMLSESIELDTNIFREDGGPVVSKTPGTLAVAPPYRVIEEFQEHWRAVFTDVQTYIEAVSENPWLFDVYRKISGCSPCVFTPMTEQNVLTKFPSQPLYVQYAIFAAHAHALAIRNVQSQFCGNSNGICEAMASGFKPYQMFNEMKDLSLDFNTDFSFSLSSLTADNVSLILAGVNGTLRAEPSFQLFNFRKTDEQTSEFGFVKIGNLNGSIFTLNTEDIRDYSDGTTETRWPNIRKAQCSIGQNCAECVPRDLPERFVLVSGDVYVVGVVSVYERATSEECGVIRTINGYQLVEALKFAVTKANEKTGAFTDFFKDITVGLIVLNTCNNQVVAQRGMYVLQKFGLTLPSGEHLDLEGKIMGFVGDVGSSISIAVAQALTRLRFVQISFASTSFLLNDRNTYPYFMRVLTPDDAQAKVLIDVVKQLGGNYIQILYSRGAYGEGGLAKVLESAKENGVCVAAQIEVVEDNANYYIYYEQLRKNPQAQIVITFLRSHVVRPLMSAINEELNRGEFVFIGSATWAKNLDVLANDVNRNLLGSLSVAIELAESTELKTHIINIQPTVMNKNPWSKQYLEAKLNCYYPDSFDKSKQSKCEDVLDFKTDPEFTLSPWVSSAYYAMTSLLLGTGNHLKLECGDNAKSLCGGFIDNIDGLIARLKEVQLDLHGLGAIQKVFNENGDGNVGYNIYQIQRDANNPQKLTYNQVGQYPFQGAPSFNTDLVVSPTPDGITSSCPNEQACSVCFGSEKNNEPLVTKDIEEKSDVLPIVLGVILAVSIVVIIVLIVSLVRNYLTTTSEQDNYASANDLYLHPTEMTPRPPTEGTQYHGIEFEEQFDYPNPEEMDFDRHM